MYTRKTRDLYNVEQYTGSQYGWEPVSQAETRKEAQALKNDYLLNQPEYPVRIRKVREPLYPVPTA